MLKLSKLLDFFFVEECIGCEKTGNMICGECKLEILNEEKNSLQNLENTKSIEWVRSPLLYKNEILRKAIFKLKYHYVKSVSKYLSELIYKDFLDFINGISNKNNIESIIIIPIPISKKRLIERNYNQSEIIANEVLNRLLELGGGFAAAQKEISLLSNLLLKQKHTIKFAHTHSVNDRQNLIKDAFKINEKYKRDFLENKIIILFDDVTTTGSTFYEARNTFINFGIKKENIFAFAVAH